MVKLSHELLTISWSPYEICFPPAKPALSTPGFGFRRSNIGTTNMHFFLTSAQMMVTVGVNTLWVALLWSFSFLPLINSFTLLWHKKTAFSRKHKTGGYKAWQQIEENLMLQFFLQDSRASNVFILYRRTKNSRLSNSTWKFIWVLILNSGIEILLFSEWW